MLDKTSHVTTFYPLTHLAFCRLMLQIAVIVVCASGFGD